MSCRDPSSRARAVQIRQKRTRRSTREHESRPSDGEHQVRISHVTADADEIPPQHDIGDTRGFPDDPAESRYSPPCRDAPRNSTPALLLAQDLYVRRRLQTHLLYRPLPYDKNGKASGSLMACRNRHGAVRLEPLHTSHRAEYLEMLVWQVAVRDVCTSTRDHRCAPSKRS